jgi:NAD(P)-dependent dehydrogenase (short-subunit alcohol dehydrogenase family)
MPGAPAKRPARGRTRSTVVEGTFYVRLHRPPRPAQRPDHPGHRRRSRHRRRRRQGLCRPGATVLLLGKTEANLNEVYDQIEAAGHPQPAVIPFNLETALPHQYDELAAMIETVRPPRRPAAQRLDHRPAHADGAAVRRQLHAGDAHQRQRHVHAHQHLLPLLKLSEDASVVFTSSSVGRKGRAYWGAYGVSKFATEGLMQTLADELKAWRRYAPTASTRAPRVRMRAQAYPSENPQNNPLPEEIMPVYLYLMGPDSKESTARR